jgi:uncharacterized protein YdeI (YjbR/CyaY-like superfamily)
MKPVHFSSGEDFRQWLEKNHSTSTELLLAFHGKNSGKGGITYAEALDEALCYGWIDGVRKNAGPDRYTIRFTPRKPRSIWSLVNVRHVERLQQLGRMRPPGEKAFAAREATRTGIYSFENRPKTLPPEFEKRFRANRPAWKFFEAQPPGYRRLMVWRVVSAKQEATRLRRLEQLIAASAARLRMDALTSKPKRPAS